MTWYYVKDGEATGPIPDDELLSLFDARAISSSTLVWRSGMADWKPASEIVPSIAPRVESVAHTSTATVVNAPPVMGDSAPPVLPHFFCTFCGNIIPADQLVRISGRVVCAACKPAYVRRASEGIDSPVKVPVLEGAAAPTSQAGDLADPGTRLVAYILDLIVIAVPIFAGYVLMALLLLGVSALMGATGGTNTDAPAAFVGIAFIVFGLLIIFWIFFYWTYFLGSRGATLGMKWMKLKMVRGDRTQVSYGLALVRALLLYFINAFTMGLTNLTAFFDRERRTVVDMLCNTRVVRN
jgi:uncharacterized RDD family membrane protein YckC